MKWFWIVLVSMLLGLQYRLWVGEGSFAELHGLREKMAEQEAQNQQLQERNDKLRAEVADLKQGLEAIEERARSELGMIKEGETFYQLVGEPAQQYQPAQ